jgi:kynurenine formamidase
MHVVLTMRGKVSWPHAAGAFAGFGGCGVSPRIVDLSVTVTTETKGPPSTDVRVELEPRHRGPGFWQVSHIYESLHTGAHVDSPLHCFADGPTVIETPLEKVIGQAALFDLSHVGANEPVTADALERTDPGLQAGQIALLWTGWTDRRYGTFPEYFTQSPYLALDAAQWLVARQPSAVVFDFFEEYMARFPDFTSEDFTVHRELLGNSVVIVEGATNLGALKGARSISSSRRSSRWPAPKARLLGCSPSSTTDAFAIAALSDVQAGPDSPMQRGPMGAVRLTG